MGDGDMVLKIEKKFEGTMSIFQVFIRLEVYMKTLDLCDFFLIMVKIHYYINSMPRQPGVLYA